VGDGGEAAAALASAHDRRKHAGGCQSDRLPKNPRRQGRDRHQPTHSTVDWVDPPESASLPLSWAYRTLVPKVDSDGNETSGIRLPPIGAPIGSYTGWNLYKSPFTEGALCDRDGSFFAFARTKAERERAGDGRPSLEERYGNRAGYVAQVKAVAEKLVTQRLLLSEDVQRYVEWAEKNSPFPGPAE